jgi:VanZ family protein
VKNNVIERVVSFSSQKPAPSPAMTQHRHRHVGRSAVSLRKPFAIPQDIRDRSGPHDVWSTTRARLIAPISENVKMPENFAKNPLSALLRAAFLGSIIALTTLAWLPAKAITRTILGGHAEHFIAYLGTAIIMGLTFQKSPRLAVQCVLLTMYAAILEAGQLYSPGRHASFQDLAFSSAGVVTGGLILWMARPRVLSWLKIG